MIYTILYLIGYISSYILGRYFWRNIMKEDYNYGTVILSATISLFSWLCFIAYIISVLELISVENKSKPPKWL